MPLGSPPPAPPTISALPPAPQPTMEPAVFKATAFEHVAALEPMRVQQNAQAAAVNALAEYTQDAALFAEAASDVAIAAAEAASAFSNATKWVSGTAYADGAVVWSPVTYLSYRRKGAGAGATDPSADSGPAGNWVLQDKGPVGALLPINANTPAVRFATYELGNAALTLTLPAAPLVGDWVGVIPSGLPVSGQVIGRNANNIMGLAENMTVDVDAIPFRLVYVGVTRGWVISA